MSTSITNPHDTQTWERMAAIKSNILKRWDTAVTGIRVCCIKFVQRVVQVQTPGVIADPRVREVKYSGRCDDTNITSRDLNRVKSLLLLCLETIP